MCMKKFVQKLLYHPSLFQTFTLSDYYSKNESVEALQFPLNVESVIFGLIEYSLKLLKSLKLLCKSRERGVSLRYNKMRTIIEIFKFNV